MFGTRRTSSLAIAAGVLSLLVLCAAVVGAQSNPPATNQNCAVSTTRIGSIDVTQFFGLHGGATSFAENFMTASGQGTTSQSSQTPAQLCIRLEVENPTPGDLIPVGGYVLGGFTFDPTAAAS